MLAFTAQRLMTPTETFEHPLLLVDGGKVVEIADRSSRSLPANTSHLNLGETVIAPGYIDVHIHGSAGFDVMQDDEQALPAVARALSQHGVTSYYPTTVTSPRETTLRALARLADAIEAGAHRDGEASRGARPLGIHLEGPFISHLRRGVHPAADLLPPTLENFESFWQAARGHIRIMTIAPELDGALQLIAEAAKRGVCVSLGHSDADFDTAERGVAAGARHATHTFNAMRPLAHRDPGVLGAVLTDDRLTADIIVDGIHLDPAIVALVARVKGPEHVVLITDGLAATGMPDGHYHLGSIDVDVRDGKCMGNGTLAGSVLTMDKAVRNLMRFSGWKLAQAAAAGSRNPARVLGLAQKGQLAPGADADFVVLNPAGDVLRTFIGGAECPTQ